MVTAFRFTTEDLECFPDLPGVRYEIIDGELYVSTAPHWEHQYAQTRSTFGLEQWNERAGLGVVLAGPGVIFGPPDNVIPDLIWISRERLAAGRDEAGHLRLAPELVVEVLSPGRVNEIRDRELKLALYGRQGVGEYWIIDWRARAVEVYRPQDGALRLAETLAGDATLSPPLLPGFSTPIATLWAPVL